MLPSTTPRRRHAPLHLNQLNRKTPRAPRSGFGNNNARDKQASVTTTHIVTGATGFVGAALVIELLRRTADPIVAIVRGGDSTSEQRFRAAILAAAEAYAIPDLHDLLDRCSVMSGDLLLPECGVTEPVGIKPGARTTFWHCAASLRFENRHQAEIEATNIEGTRNALALATRLGVTTFNHVSTAYVAGTSSGLIPEALPGQVESNNHYERSKVAAERLVAASTQFRTRILRPSIVIGHGTTLAATTFTGFYGFLRQLVQLRGMLERAQSGLADRTALQMRVDPDVPLNLITIDQVAEELARIGLSDEGSGVFHISHPNPPTVGVVVRQLCRAAGLPDPIYVSSKEGFSWLDQKLDDRITFYGSYLIGDRQFDRAETNRVLDGRPGPSPTFDVATIDRFAAWYTARLEAERQNLPVVR